MTKFDQVGVEFQYDARNKKEANRSFQYSCRVCCERGMHIECDRCAIAATNAILVAAFDTEMTSFHQRNRDLLNLDFHSA